MPIEVRCRAKKLEDALLLFYKGEEQERLRGLSLSVIQDEKTRSHVKTELEKTNVSDVKSWKDIIVNPFSQLYSVFC